MIKQFMEFAVLMVIVSSAMQMMNSIMSTDDKKGRKLPPATTTALVPREPYAVVRYNLQTPSLEVFGVEVERIPTGPEYDSISMTEIGERQKTVIHIPKDLPVREKEPVKEPVREPVKEPVRR